MKIHGGDGQDDRDEMGMNEAANWHCFACHWHGRFWQLWMVSLLRCPQCMSTIVDPVDW